jgi:hypothetical protein
MSMPAPTGGTANRRIPCDCGEWRKTMTDTFMTRYSNGRVPTLRSLLIGLVALCPFMNTTAGRAAVQEAVINSVIELIPAGEARRDPFQKMVSSDCGQNRCQLPVVTIRRNRRIELSHASCTASIEAGGTITNFDVSSFSTVGESGGTRSFQLPVFAKETDGQSFYNTNNPVSLVATTGDKIVVALNATTKITGLQCKISGDVVVPDPGSEPGRDLFQAFARPDCDTLFCGGGLFRVPRDKRLVITHIACAAAIDSDGTIERLGVRRKTPGGPGNDFDFQVPRASGRAGNATIYFSNTETRLTAENRDLVSVELETSDNINFLNCSVSGELTKL